MLIQFCAQWQGWHSRISLCIHILLSPWQKHGSTLFSCTRVSVRNCRFAFCCQDFDGEKVSISPATEDMPRLLWKQKVLWCCFLKDEPMEATGCVFSLRALPKNEFLNTAASLSSIIANINRYEAPVSIDDTLQHEREILFVVVENRTWFCGTLYTDVFTINTADAVWELPELLKSVSNFFLFCCVRDSHLQWLQNIPQYLTNIINEVADDPLS